MADPFATPDDLVARWRPLTGPERDRATVLLADASALIRSLAAGIDAKITAGTMDPLVPKAVACAMVKRQMQGPADLDGVSQHSETKGPFSESVTFANPSGDLYLTKTERQQLGISTARQRAGHVDMFTIPNTSS